MIGLGQVAGVEQGLADSLQVVLADRIGEDRQQVIDTVLDTRKRSWVVERGVHLPGVDQPPAIAEIVGVDAVDMKSAPGPKAEWIPR